MDRSIVCGVDGSPDSQTAIGVAARLAERLAARLVLAHVVEAELLPYAGIGRAGGVALPPMIPLLREEQEEAGARLLERIAVAVGLGDVEQRIALGHPAERLADLADDEQAELIVVGSRGSGRFKAAFLGSVSNSLVGVARCPVLIVPPGVSPGFG